MYIFHYNWFKPNGTLVLSGSVRNVKFSELQERNFYTTFSFLVWTRGSFL